MDSVRRAGPGGRGVARDNTQSDSGNGEMVNQMPNRQAMTIKGLKGRVGNGESGNGARRPDHNNNNRRNRDEVEEGES
jgi:hypothetical protein